MKIPYGIADFYALRTEGYLYVDRTDRISVLEELGKALLFLRPRRFGKTLWLRTLAAYYDLRCQDEHDRIFGGLAVGREPTPLAHRYFVLAWDFSNIDPRGDAEAIGRRLHSYVNNTVRSFARAYRQHLPEPIEIESDPVATLGNLLSIVSETPYGLYLLVDEYDNFANEAIVADESTYRRLVHADGPFKALFKWVKAAMAGEGLERLFLTGVSPVVMSDVTSGLNIARNVYLHPRLNDLCGFREGEVRDLLEAVISGRGDRRDDGEPDAGDALEMMREWYNGYRFAPDAGSQVYNPTLALYFLLHLWEQGSYPRQMLDANLAADEAKLEVLGETAATQSAVFDAVSSARPLEIAQLQDRFPLRAMLERRQQDASFLGSYLYYFGMLTLAGETEFRTLLLSPPNQVVRKLYVERIMRFLLPRGDDRTAALEPVRTVLRGGSLEPLLDFVEATIFTAFSNRDARWANELTVKAVFLTLLWDDVSYVAVSEAELGRGYADLCLLRRPDARASSLSDLLFELKRLSLSDLGMSGQKVKATPREELARLEPVELALDEAEAQLKVYSEALERRLGSDLDLRSWAVVALGFERLVARPFGG